MKEQVKEFDTEELDPIGHQIIQLLMNDAPIEEYLKITPLDMK